MAAARTDENTYSVKNTVQLMDDLLRIPQGHQMKFASFDISNMYSNIPTGELTSILNDLCIKNNVDDKTKKRNLKNHTNHNKPKLLPIPRQYLPTKGRTSHGHPHIIRIVRNLPTTHGGHYNPQTAK
jgi:hypothetical protein